MSIENIENGYTQFVKTQVILESIKNIGLQDLSKYQLLLYKIATCIDTEDELKNFIEFCTRMFQAGYYKSAFDHKEALQKIGYTTDLNLVQN